MSLQAKLVSAQNPQQVLLHAANARPGTPYKVSVKELQALQLSDPATGQPPQQVWAKRQGDNLLVTAQDAAAQAVQIEVEDYYAVAEPPEVQGMGPDGQAQPFLTAQAAADLPVSAVESGSTGGGWADGGVWSYLGDEGWSVWALGGLGLAGGALLVRNSGDDDDAASAAVLEAQPLSDTVSADGVELSFSLPASAVAGDVLTTVITLPDGTTQTVTTTLTAADIAAGEVSQTLPANAVASNGGYTASTQLIPASGTPGEAISQTFTVSGGAVSAGTTGSGGSGGSGGSTGGGSSGGSDSGSGDTDEPVEETPDTTAPSVSMTDNMSGTANGDVTYTFTFSEAVSGFTASDITLTNGTAGAFTAVSGSVYTLVVTPTPNASGDLTVDIAAGVAQDAAGNANTAATPSVQPFDTTVSDTSAPTVTISDNVSGTASGPITFTFTFSEPVEGFSADDVVVANGAASAFTAVSSTVFTLTVTPTANTTGNVTVNVPAAVAQDLAGNANSAATPVSQPFDTTLPDTTAPSVTVTDNVSGTATGDVTFTFTFSEPVTGFAASDVALTNGTAGTFTAVSSTQYTLVVTPTAGTSGNITVNVPAGVAVDAAGNTSTAATEAVQAFNTTVPDTVAPTVTVTDDIEGTATGDVTFTFTFSEPVTGFAASDVALTNGTAGTFTAVSSTQYTLVVTPTANSTGTLTVDVAAGAATDSAGNPSASATASQVFDTVASTEPEDISLTNITTDSGIAVTGKARWLEWADFDGDGDKDLLVGVSESAVRLYSNDGDGSFTDVTAATIGTVSLKLGGATWIDYDQDGDLDIFLAGESTANQLLQNNAGVFTNVAAAAGVASSGKVKGLEAVDFDGDGDKDLFLTVEGGANILYQNNGNGTFTDIASTAGVTNSGLKNRTVNWVDFDGDGDLDLFVGVHESADKLYANNGNGTFTDVSSTAGMSTSTGKVSATTWGDFDGDGDMDLFIAGEDSLHQLYVNNGNGTFTEGAAAAGVAGVASQKGKATLFADLNEDGFDDLIVTGDSVTTIYQSNGDGTFTDVTTLNTGVTTTTKGRDISVADIDSDGDLDVAVSSEEGTLVSLYVNDLVSPVSGLGAKSLAVAVADTDDEVLVVTFDDDGVAQTTTADSGATATTVVVASEDIILIESDAIAG